MSRNYIDHYVIEVMYESSLDPHWCFLTGYKTLPTMRKKFNQLKEFVPGGKVAVYGLRIIKARLVARDYDKNIVKVYEVI